MVAPLTGEEKGCTEVPTIPIRQDDSQPTTPTKKNKAAGPTEAEVSLLAKVNEAKVLLKEAKEKATKMEREFAKRIEVLEDAAVSSDSQLANLKMKIKVRNNTFFTINTVNSCRLQKKLHRSQLNRVTENFSVNKTSDSRKFYQHSMQLNWRWRSA